MEMRHLPTGLGGLDSLLGGGLPAGHTLLVSGPRGSGKTVLCCQVAFSFAARGLPTAFVTLSAEPHQKLLESVESFRFYDRNRLGKELILMSAHPYLKRGAKEARDVILSTARDHKAKLVVVEAVHLLSETWRDPSAVREFVAELAVGLGTLDCVGLFTAGVTHEGRAGAPEAASVDGILELSLPRRGMGRRHWVEVVKLRGRVHPRGEHCVRIGERGVELYPRLETLPLPRRSHQGEAAPVMLGVPGMEQLLPEGVIQGSQTLIEGPAGSGKTWLAAQFLLEGARNGERALLVAPARDEEALAHRLGALGSELSRAVDSGALELLALDSTHQTADEVASDLFERIQRGGLSRVAVDGLDELLVALDSPERDRSFLTALGNGISSLRTTALYTWDLSGRAETERLSPAVRDNVLRLELGESVLPSMFQIRMIRTRGAAAMGRPHLLLRRATGLEVGPLVGEVRP